MNRHLEDLKGFLLKKNLFDELSFLKKISKTTSILSQVNKEEVFSKISSMDFALTFESNAKAYNKTAGVIGDLIKGEVIKNYPKHIREYFNKILSEEEELKLVMSQFQKDSITIDEEVENACNKIYTNIDNVGEDSEEYVKWDKCLDTKGASEGLKIQKTFNDPNDTINLIIDRYVGYIFNIVFDTSEFDPCKLGPSILGCNSMSTIYLYVDRIFKLEPKLSRWLEMGVLDIEYDERVSVENIGREQIYLGDGTIFKSDGLESQNFDILNKYKYIFKVYNTLFTIKNDQKIKPSGGKYSIKHEDLPNHIQSLLADKAYKVVTSDIGSFFGKIDHILEHEMLHTKQYLQNFNNPDFKNPNDLKKEHKEAKYEDYGWSGIIKNILKNKIKKEKNLSSINDVKLDVSYIQPLAAHHTNFFGIHLKDLFQEIFGDRSVTEIRFKKVFNSKISGDTLYYQGRPFDVEDSVIRMFEILKEVQGYLENNRSLGYFKDVTTGSYRYHTFKEIIKKITEYSDVQVNLEPEDGEDILDFNEIETFDKLETKEGRKNSLFYFLKKSIYTPPNDDRKFIGVGKTRKKSIFSNEKIDPNNDIKYSSYSIEVNGERILNEEVVESMTDSFDAYMDSTFNITVENPMKPRFGDNSGIGVGEYAWLQCDDFIDEECSSFYINLKKFKGDLGDFLNEILNKIINKNEKLKELLDKKLIDYYSSNRKANVYYKRSKSDEKTLSKEELLFLRRFVYELNQQASFGSVFEYELKGE